MFSQLNQGFISMAIQYGLSFLPWNRQSKKSICPVCSSSSSLAILISTGEHTHTLTHTHRYKSFHSEQNITFRSIISIHWLVYSRVPLKHKLCTCWCCCWWRLWWHYRWQRWWQQQQQQRFLIYSINNGHCDGQFSAIPCWMCRYIVVECS